MRIRTKLTIIYTAITALLLICLNLYIYYSASNYIRKIFYTELKQRALLTAQVYLEQDEMEANLFKQIKNKFLQTLPNEETGIYDKNNSPAFIDSPSTPFFSYQIINHVRHEKYLEFEDRDRQIVGIFYPDNQGDFVIIVSAINKNGITRLYFLKDVLIFGFVFCLIIIFILGRFFSKQALSPMSNIIKNVNKISASNLHLRIDEGKGKDEISELAITFNNMLTRLETVFESQKTFIQNASHELRTPLTSIIIQTEVVLSKERSIEEYKENLKSNLLEAEKLSQLTTNLLNLAKSYFDDAKLNLENIYIDDLILEVRKEIESQADSRIIKVEYIIPLSSKDLVISGNRQLLRIAFFNIVENACKFSANDEVRITLDCSDKKIKIAIIDKGIGIPINEAEKIFEPFYRASNARNYLGSGVGLSLTKKIMELHSGKISVSDNPTGGVLFEIIFTAGLNTVDKR
jgi:two-component system sensor histidine kinase ArlS